MKTWRICVLGAGMFSEVHLRAWRSLPDVEVVALCDPHTDRRAAKAARWNVPSDGCHDDLKAALAAQDLDVVDVVTPLATHRELVLRAAEAGKHVLCQKPLATSVNEGREMEAACRKHGVRLMVAEAFRWRAHHLKIKEVLDAGALGDLHFARLRAKSFFSPRWAEPGVLQQPFLRTMPRLLVQEMGPHWFDLYLHFFGEPASVSCLHRRASPHAAGEDQFVLTCGHERMIGLVEASWYSREFLHSPHVRADGVNLMDEILVEGSAATLRLNPAGDIEIIYDRGAVEPVSYERGEYHDAHRRMHRHFLDRLTDGQPFATEGESNLRVLALIEAAYRSGENL